MLTKDITLALVNANVLTMQPYRPRAEAVAIAGERIVSVGSDTDIRSLAPPSSTVIDCHGCTLIPGFNDAHCHLPGLASQLQDLDCSPGRASSIPVLQDLIRKWAATRPAGSWIRGHGYDDLQIAERRHPSRWDLDAATLDYPIWLEHRSGHAVSLNSMALELAGIHRETPDPPGAVIERDLISGELTGTLFEMRSFLRRRVGQLRTQLEFEEGMQKASRLLTQLGITSVQDAGEDNSIDRWQTFQGLRSEGLLSVRITMLAGGRHLAELLRAGLSFGFGDRFLRLGHAKIVATLTSGTLNPDSRELADLTGSAHRQGFPVAIHCIEEETTKTVANVLATRREPGLTDRIEHCAEGTPEAIEAVRSSGASVVTNPGLIYVNGATYRLNVNSRVLPHLYPAGALLRQGIHVAFGSDAPVASPNPWPGIYSAVTRRAGDRFPLSDTGHPEVAVTVDEALRMYTTGGAQAEGTAGEKGMIAPGMLADLALLESDPLTSDTEHLPEVQAAMTVVGGNIVWSII